MNDATQFFNAGGGYEIERSLRFNSSDTAYLSRTPSVAGNRKTFTLSCWVKKATLGTDQGIFNAGTSSASSGVVQLYFMSSNQIAIFTRNSSGVAAYSYTTSVYRDASAWYHIVLSIDTTQASFADQQKLWVNGVQVTTWDQSQALTQNTDLLVNSTVAHYIGGLTSSGGSLSNYLSSYLADYFLIDGQALTPTSFGKFDTNGVWQPKAYAGSYGTNGFHLPFSDNSTAAALGTDTSGNGNTWTVNNLSVTAGAGNDSIVGSPTNGSQVDTGVGGEVVGNYATLNPLDNGGLTLSNGNLQFDRATASWISGRATIGMSSGKWYWEVVQTTGTSMMVGISKGDASQSSYVGAVATGWAYNSGDGNKYNNASNSAYGNTYTTNDVIGVAFDVDSGDLKFYKNGTVQNSGTAAYTGLTSGPYFPAVGLYGTATAFTNFGFSPFAYTAPSGFKALCTTNLPSTTITTSGSYTGNGVADGPFVYLNGVPTAMTVGGNAVTFGTHADKLSNGFKVRTNNTTYNQNAVVYTYSITSTGDPFKTARAQSN
jgi:hypothetical protein